MEPNKHIQALADSSWVEAMQEELLQFRLQKVWRLVDLPKGKHAIGKKWVYRNKKYERGIVVRNKARLVAQEEEVYVCQPPCFENPQFPNKVYKVDKALYGLHQAHRACTVGLSLYYWMELCIASTKDDAARPKENAEFHHIVDFLSTCSINYALTVSPTIYASYIKQFWNTATSKTINSVKQIHAIVDGKAVVISESSVRSDLLVNDEDVSHELHTEAHIEQILPSPSTYQRKQRKTQKHRRAKKVTELPQTSVPLDHGADEAIYKEGSQAPRNHRGAPAQTRSKRVLEKPNKPPLPEGHTFGSGEGSMEHTFQLTDNVPNTPHDSHLSGGYTPESDEGRFELIQELMKTCTSLTKRVLALEEAKTAQDIRRLFKGRVKSSDDDLDKEDASKQERTDDKTKPMFQDSEFDELDDHTATTGVSVVSAPVTTAGVAISTAKPRTPPTTIATEFMDEDLAIAQTLVKIRSEKAKAKGISFSDVEETLRLNRSTTTLQPLLTIDSKDKELAQRIHEEELTKLDKAQKERQLQEEATSAGAALAEEFDDIQARIDVDHELAVRLTHKEQEKYTIEERGRLLAEFFERRKKQLVAERAEAIRKKPPTRTQVRNMMITYLKHMDSMDVVPRDDVSINVESLATKYPIIDWKTHILNENMMYYQISRANGSFKNYNIFSEMVVDFDRQDVIDILRLVNERYETTSPEGYDLWRLFNSCGVHVLLMNTGVAIHMMIEKKYPLTQEMLSRMLNRRLEVDSKSEMAFELIKFTRPQLQNWKDDGYCNGGNLPGTYFVEKQLHYQDLEWYKALEDSELKDLALQNKASMEGLIIDDDNNNEREELREIHEPTVCNIRIFKMIKYSFGQNKEYVAIKEDEYDDLTRTSNDACRPHEGNIDKFWWRIYKFGNLEVLES
ncbi:putative ribonuclease H-like domain-containing protein [Tanacetum coccineum]